MHALKQACAIRVWNEARIRPDRRRDKQNAAPVEPLSGAGEPGTRLSLPPCLRVAIDKLLSICDDSIDPRETREPFLERSMMAQDVELMRDLMLALEARQLSPRSTVVISLESEADDLGCMPDVVAESLNLLLDLDYIDGPGQDEMGYWLFRQLTRKGRNFVSATRRSKDWEKMKRHFAVEPSS